VLQLKDLRCTKIVQDDGGEALLLGQLEGPRGGRAWLAGHFLSGRAGIRNPDKIGICDRLGYGGQAEESCRLNKTIIAFWYVCQGLLVSGLDVMG
jgi:hypothetical protein